MIKQVPLKLYDVYFIGTSNIAAANVISTSPKKACEQVATQQGISKSYLKAKVKA